tara:strand:+ start:4334 stop:5275 length:942 start_codon:yes stop_codon:yes gene_type:complete
MNTHNVIVIGSGPAGYTACIYASRALLKPLLISGNMKGGQLMTTSDVENFPGYAKGIIGPDLMSDLHQQAIKFGTKVIDENVTKIEESNPFKVITKDNEYFTKSIIVASGSSAVWLNAANEEELRGKGISTCATCDGAFFKDEEIVVVGGGDSAMEEATFLTRFAKKVTLIHRRNEFRASKIMLEKAKNNEKIHFKTPYTVQQWKKNENGLLGAKLINQNDESVEELNCTGAFIAIGHNPNIDFLPKNVELNLDGYIKVQKDTMMTSIPGIFACGDVTETSQKYKQAITAAGEGCRAALDMEKWLENQEIYDC